ncbi:MAG: CPBP family intramembrane metalloprotease [Candidatus Omnitrophica bacterium]|nr:CPBP family intramembrane metalloprotease [Candidatus Omnitrophota bacterium]
MKKIFLSLAAAFGFWFLMFSPWTSHKINFWFVMMCASGALAGWGCWAQRFEVKKIFPFEGKHAWIGLISAIVLYSIFWLGKAVILRLVPFGAGEISRVYFTKLGADPRWIAAALLFWIGPGEEIFWRGYIQRKLSSIMGSGKGYWVTSLIYALVHIWSFNLSLFLAALICGLFWGFLFRKFNSIWPSLISHSLWDVLIFIIFPLG